MFGVDIWVDPGTLIWAPTVASNPEGYTEFNLPLSVTVPVGAKLYVQFLWLSACGSQGFSASNALELTIQP